MFLLLVFITIIALIVSIVKFKVSPFLCIVVACVFLGFSTGMEPVKIVKTISSGLASTLGSIALIVGFGALIGKLMGESGAAEVIAVRMIKVVGEKNVDLAMMFAAFTIGYSVFFSVGFILLIPLLFTIALRTGSSLVTLTIPLVATLSALHHYVPPHPAAMALVQMFHADLGRSLIYGIIVSIPCATVGGLFYGRYIGKRITAKPSAEFVEKFCGGAVTHANPPGFGVSVCTLLFPIFLIMLSQVADAFLAKNTFLFQLFKFIGDGSMALMFSVLLALYTFGFARGFTKEQIQKWTADCLSPIAMILLVVGAGGAFGQILIDSGVAKAVVAIAINLHIPPLLFGWLLAALLRIGVGSATVAMITSAGLVLPLVAPGSGTSPELMLMSLGAGSLVLSHVNDGSFWLIKEYLGLTMEETLKTWTASVTIMAFVGLGVVMIMSALGM